MKREDLPLLVSMTLLIQLAALFLGSVLHAATISGTVYDCDGDPIAGSGGTGSGAYVYVLPMEGEPCLFHQTAGTPVWVQSDGTYVLTVPAGTYYIRAQNLSYGSPHNDYVSEWRTSSGSSDDCHDADAITVSILTETSGVDFELDCGAIQIEGTVRDSGGNPIASPGIHVHASFGDPCYRPNVFSAYPINPGGLPPGFYYLSGLPSGRAYQLRAYNYSGLTYANEWWVSTGSTINCNAAESVTTSRTGTDFHLDGGAIAVSGTVKDSEGNAITGDSVSVMARLGEPCSHSRGLTGTWTDPADGTYLIGGLPAGLTYYISTYDSWQDSHVNEWWADPQSAIECCHAQPITATSASIDFQLDSGAASISGVVRDSGGTSITGESLLIGAYRGNPCGLKRGSAAWTDPFDGSYEISGLPAGIYRLLHLNWLGNDYLNEWWDSSAGSQDCNDAEPLTISSGTAEIGKDFFLDSGAIAISGAVTDSGDTPVTGGQIYVGASSSSMCGGAYQPLEWFGYTDFFDGTYMVSGLPSGSYYLNAQDLSEQPDHILEWYASSGSVTDCSLAESVTGDSTDVDFSLDGADGTISGTVKDYLGNPLTDAQIMVGAFSCDTDACGNKNPVGATFASHLQCDGTYEIPVAGGTYYLNALDIEGYYASEWWASSASSPSCSDAEPITVLPSQANRDFQLGIQIPPVPTASGWGIALLVLALGSASWIVRRRSGQRSVNHS